MMNRVLIKKLLREAIDSGTYSDWVDGMDLNAYEVYSLKNPEKVRRYWSLYSMIYDKIIRKAMSKVDLLHLWDNILPRLGKEEQEAFKIFSLYRECELSEG